MSPALADGFSTTEPPGKPWVFILTLLAILEKSGINCFPNQDIIRAGFILQTFFFLIFQTSSDV